MRASCTGTSTCNRLSELTGMVPSQWPRPSWVLQASCWEFSDKAPKRKSCLQRGKKSGKGKGEGAKDTSDKEEDKGAKDVSHTEQGPADQEDGSKEECQEVGAKEACDQEEGAKETDKEKGAKAGAKRKSKPKDKETDKGKKGKRGKGKEATEEEPEMPEATLQKNVLRNPNLHHLPSLSPFSGPSSSRRSRSAPWLILLYLQWLF